MGDYILSLDQGTTSSRALVFDKALGVCGVGQTELTQHYPHSGWVEHDANDIFNHSLQAAKDAVDAAGLSMADIAAVGITNQRETTVLWDRETGEPLSRAIVWQDRRTSQRCRDLTVEQREQITLKTGLLPDPYFSATKLEWLLSNMPGARGRAEAGELCFGTVDSWLMFKLTGGARHVIDATNASRTMLYNIHRCEWDENLLVLFDIPPSLLPEVKDCIDDFGVTAASVLGAELPIKGVAGDQHAALIGQACFTPGMMKSTYGTGCFAMLNIGEVPVRSENNLLTTLAYRINGRATYALEGSIFIAGAAVQWLRDELKLIKNAGECDELAAHSNRDDPVVLVPAFAGLGAPYWQADARGALMNMTRGTGRAEIVRATLESVGLQSLDLMRAMAADWGKPLNGAAVLRVDGGMARSDWTMQFLSDILDCEVARPANTETTALGAAYLAGRGAGLYEGFEAYAALWAAERQFMPEMGAAERTLKYQRWQEAVKSLLPHASG
ncbi:MAG: glycerol kinase [Rhodomicrobium sp.]|nr:MAG: glycerol kinase [Rhodomicrobium sp.]